MLPIWNIVQVLTSAQLFPPSGLLEFIAVDILVPLQRTMSGNQFMVIITGRYTEQPSVILILNIWSNHAAHVLLND